MYLTIRQEAKHPDCPFSEYRLRIRKAEGRLPGIRAGNRFLVDHDALVRMARIESITNAGGVIANES